MANPEPTGAADHSSDRVATLSQTKIRTRSSSDILMGDENKNNKEKKKSKAYRSPRGILGLLQHILIDSGALKSSMINFLLCYNIRAGVSVLLHVVKVLRKDPKQIFKLLNHIGEKSVSFRLEAVRLGLFVGGFTGIYKVINSLLRVIAAGRIKWWHSAVAGYTAGSSLVFMTPDWHRTLALYMATRAAQCGYNLAKKAGYWHFWGSDWAHGDSLLFILSSAQVMYAYVMRPETIPKSYYKFIVNQGPIDEVVLQAVRANNRGRPMDMTVLRDYVEKKGGSNVLEQVKGFLAGGATMAAGKVAAEAMVPSLVLHPDRQTLIGGAMKAFIGVSKQIFPVYLTLAYVPAVVLRFQRYLDSPVQITGRALLSALRSTLFLATFCGSYMAAIDMHRLIASPRGWKDHKLVYWAAGVLSSMSILIEQKHRRAELALYAFPRGMDSLYMILYDHQLAFQIPYGEVVLFCASMATIMCVYENDKSAVNPFLVKILKRFLPGRHDDSKSVPNSSSKVKAKGADGDSERKTTDSDTNTTDSDTSSDSYEEANRRCSHGKHKKKARLPTNQSTLSLSGSSLVP